MKFKKDNFLRDEVERATREVACPELDNPRWFEREEGEDGPFVVTCQALTGPELAYVRESSSKSVRLEAFIKALNNKDAGKLASETAELFGLSNEMPAEASFIHRTLEKGISGPFECDMPTAVRLNKIKPILASELSNTIMALTKEGHTAVEKPQSSSPTKTSDSPSTSLTRGEDISGKTVPISSQKVG